MNGARLKRPATCALLVLGLVITMPAPASAADGWQRTKNVSDSRFDRDPKVYCDYDGLPRYEARGCFQPHGEKFWLEDRSGNDHPVVIRWRLLNGQSRVLRAGDIYNNHTSTAGWTIRDKSFAENRYVRFRVCEANIPDREVYDCGPWNEKRS